ncbi:MAG: WGR domain-containing protein, partial [Bacteroidetes bacterium]|nr:WGR domain-containing protein [Fibrella sp.]
MMRYFTFTTDTSNKFWQIDTDGVAFTVTYGKVGTRGQSQTKTFDTPERCRQEADKLIREKTGKGYVESVGGVVVESTVAGTVPRKPVAQKADSAKAETEAVLNRYDEIIRDTLTDELLPFLQSVDAKQYPALRKRIKQAETRWWGDPNLATEENNRQLIAKWGSRATKEQSYIIILSGLAMLPLQDAKAFRVYWLLADPQWPAPLLPILRWARPQWLTEFLLKTVQREKWLCLPYQHLLTLEREGLIEYSAELLSLPISRLGGYNDRDSKYLADFLASDTATITRGISALFDYPAASVLFNNRSVWDSDGNYTQVATWPPIFARLLADGKLNRSWFLEKCVSVQTRDWNSDLRSFYRKQFEAANPSPAELITLQATLFPLLAAQHPHVVNWAIGLIKTMVAESDFRPGDLVDWASPVMMRDDCKTGLKTLLSLLERLMKTQPDYQTAITHLLADVFVLNDLPLQTKAASLLTKYGDPTDTELQDRLQTYAGQMLGNVAGDLKPFLTRADADNDDQPTNV